MWGALVASVGSLIHSRQTGQVASRRHGEWRHPRLEQLEDRRLLSQYPGAIWVSGVPSTNYTDASRAAADIRWAVIHTTEGTAQSAIDWFKNPASGVSAHYVISRQGTVYQLVRDEDIAYHAGNWAYNQRSIGIEHERYGANNWTEAQFAASVELVEWLSSQYNVEIVFPLGVAPANPLDGTGVIGHAQVPDPTNPTQGGGINHHTDPVNWDWVHYRELFHGAQLSDQQKQQNILNMVNTYRGALPPELVLAVMRQEGGEGAFHVDGWNYNSFYRMADGAWAQPTNGDGVMQVTVASGHHENRGPYTHDESGYRHAIGDGCDYLNEVYNAAYGGSFLNATLHYNTGPNSLYIYLGLGAGDPNYLGNVAGHLRAFVPNTFGLRNDALATQLENGQAILNSYLNNPAILRNQPVSYYAAYQAQLDAELRGGQDTTPPTVSGFAASPTQITVGERVQISYTVSDMGGAGLSRVELWRTDDAGKAAGVWEQVAWIDATPYGNGPLSDFFVDTPPTEGGWWYGIHVLDHAGNMSVEPDPPGPIRVVVNPVPADDNYEPNNSLATAYDLSTREHTWLSDISGLGVQRDDDWYRIEVTPGYERVKVDCRFTHSQGDIDIALYDASGTVLASSTSTTDNEYIDHVVPASGAYYIRVFFGNDGNSYDLWWDDVQPPAAPPEITVLGNGVVIADNDTTPSLVDHTDFGSVQQGQPGISHTFTVRNDGGQTLTLGSVSVPRGFTLVEDLSSSLAPGASDTFTVRLETGSVGTFSGDVSFSTNDSDENPFNFRITGTVSGGSSPTATLEPWDFPVAGSYYLDLKIKYQDDVAINVATLDDQDISVLGPGGVPCSVTYLSVEPSGNGATRVATYRLEPPGEFWNPYDPEVAGLYVVTMNPEEVFDTSGNAVDDGELARLDIRWAQISGTVWSDLDDNGVRAPGEPGIAWARVYVDINGNSQYDDGEPNAYSGQDGAYTIRDSHGFPLAPGQYVVRAVPMAGWRQTAPASGAYVVTLAPGDTLAGKDFGFHDIAPPTVMVEQALMQADPASNLPIHFVVAFSEPVVGFELEDVQLGGTASGMYVEAVTGGTATYDVIVRATGAGTVIASIGLGAAHDLSGNASVASTSTDNMVTYDPAAPPTRVQTWSTYLGGTSWDHAYAVVADGAGGSFVVGATESTDFSGRTNDHHGATDAFVAHVNRVGNVLWATYLGGSGDDMAYGVTPDGAGGVFVAGETSSTDFSGSTNTYHGGDTDAFVGRVSPTGAILWVNYLGGSRADRANGVVADAAGGALVVGDTLSPDFSGNGNTYHGSYDAFVARVNPAGAVIWATCLGGSFAEWAYAVVGDGAGGAFVAGETLSTNFQGRTNRHYSGSWEDAFVARVSGTGTLLWATYVGGTDQDYAYAVAPDGAGGAFVAGETLSTDIFRPTNNPGVGQDGFVTRLSHVGDVLWSTYVGGNSNDWVRAATVENPDSILVAGYTYSTDLPGRTNSYQSGYDAFIARVDAEGAIPWSTYLGGTGHDFARGVATDGAGGTFLVGETSSTDYVWHTNSYHGGNNDAFVAKLAQLVPSRAVGRHVFYNNSAFDGNDPEANELDFAAIAPDKQALLPGEVASFANYPTLEDFEFKVGGVGIFDAGPESWTEVPPDPEITVHWAETPGEPDRVTLVWPDGAIRNKWLMVRMKASERTGLAEDDVFFFGNAVGETGNSPSNTYVDGSDFAGVRDHNTATAAIDNPYDFNRDGVVDSLDRDLVAANATNLATCLTLLDLTAYAPLTLPERSDSAGGMMLADVGMSLSPMTVSPESGSTRPATSPAGRLARLPSISGRLPADRLEQGLPAARVDLMAAAHDAVLARFAHRPPRPVVLPAEAWAWLCRFESPLQNHPQPKKKSAQLAAVDLVLMGLEE